MDMANAIAAAVQAAVHRANTLGNLYGTPSSRAERSAWAQGRSIRQTWFWRFAKARKAARKNQPQRRASKASKASRTKSRVQKAAWKSPALANQSGQKATA